MIQVSTNKHLGFFTEQVLNSGSYILSYLFSNCKVLRKLDYPYCDVHKGFSEEFLRSRPIDFRLHPLLLKRLLNQPRNRRIFSPSKERDKLDLNILKMLPKPGRHPRIKTHKPIHQLPRLKRADLAPCHSFFKLNRRPHNKTDCLNCTHKQGFIKAIILQPGKLGFLPLLLPNLLLLLIIFHQLLKHLQEELNNILCEAL